MAKTQKTGSVDQTPSGVRRQPRGEETRSKLVAAARRLIAKHGLVGVTHRSVAEEAAVSLSATTYYFKSLDDLLSEAYRAQAESRRADVDQLVSETGWRGDTKREPLDAEGVAAVFERYLLSRWSGKSEEGIENVEIRLAMARDASLRPVFAPSRKAERRFVADLLERGGSQDPVSHVECILAIVAGFELEYLALGSSARYGKKAARLAAGLLGKMLREQG